jgi:hypothetical protein
MQVGDLVKHRKCSTHGVITRIWEIPKPNFSGRRIEYSTELMLEVLWSDGKVSDTLSRRVVVV